MKEPTMTAEEVIQEAESIIQQRRAQAAARLDRDLSQVEVRRLELRQMREAGLLIDLDCHGSSMLSALNSFAELGIAADDARAKRFRAGSRDLFPGYSGKVRSLETRARANLAKYSFQVAAFGGWAWLPWSAYATWKANHDALCEELEGIKSEVLEDYADIREENRAYFAEVAERAWKGLTGQYAPGDRVMIRTPSGQIFDSLNDHDRFVEFVVQSALSKMPLPDEIAYGVHFDYRTSILYSDAEIAAEEAVIAAAHSAKAEAQAKEIEVAHANLITNAQVEAFKQAELEHARKRLAEMGSPLQEALDSLRATIYDAVKSLAAGVDKNGSLRGRANGKAAEMLSYWRALNGGLLQDDALESALETLDSKVASYRAASKEIRETRIDDIQAELENIALMTAESARKIRSQGGSRASALEL